MNSLYSHSTKRDKACAKSLVKTLSAFLFSLFACALAYGHGYTHGQLTIGHPWARASIPGATGGAVYLRLENRGGSADALIAVRTPVAEHAELHLHAMQGDIVKMSAVDRIEIPAQGKIELRPDSYHIMLFGLKRALTAGEKFPLELVFANSGAITVDVKVENTPTAP